MASRKTGLGKGLDGLFPSYTGKKTDNTSSMERKEKESGKTEGVQEDGEKVSEKQELSPETPDTEVDIDEVEPNRNQPRKEFDEEALKELAESIRQYGIIQPLVVQKKEDYYEIIAGERRWRAAREAGVKKIPVVIRNYTDQEILEISLIENIQREDLNPIEEAQAYQRLIDEFDLKQEEVARKVSKNRSTVTNSLRLLKLDVRVQQMLKDGQISSGHARALLTIDDPGLQYEMAKKAVEESWSVRDIEKEIKRLTKPEKEKNKPEKNDEAMDLICRDMEEKMKNALGTRVVVSRKSGQKGIIQIDYYSNEELERLFDLLSSLSGEKL